MAIRRVIVASFPYDDVKMAITADPAALRSALGGHHIQFAFGSQRILRLKETLWKCFGMSDIINSI
jgi:hypothetical protein